MDVGQRMFKVLSRMNGCSKLGYSEEVEVYSVLSFPMLKLMSSYFLQRLVLP